MSWLKALLSALATGLLFAGAFPPFDQWWLAWLWALPLLWLLWTQGERRGWRQFLFGFRWGWLAGYFVFGGTLWWVAHVTVPGMFIMCAYLALFPAVWGGLAALLKPRSPGRGFLSAFALAMLWCGLEWTRGVLLTGFPWNGAAVPLVEMPGLRSLARYAAVTGVSMLPLFFMTGLAAAWILLRHRNTKGRASLLAASLATPILLTMTTWDRSSQPTDRLQVLLVQPNVSMEVKLNLNLLPLPVEEREAQARKNEVERYTELEDLTRQGLTTAKIKPELIVWPESALPRLFHDPVHAKLFGHLFQAGAVTLITGCEALTADVAASDDWNAHNCAALIHKQPENFYLHAKYHLVPFGEYIPLRKELPFLEDMLGDLIPSDFTAGKSLEPLRAEGLKYEVIPLVCFEDTIPDVARRFVRDTPQLMVNVTNDNWFHRSNESAIHALNARWRCIELQRPMVRSANTGLTCVIDTEGRVTDDFPRWKQGALHASVPLYPGGITFYAAHGDVISMAAGAAGCALAIFLLLTNRRFA